MRIAIVKASFLAGQSNWSAATIFGQDTRLEVQKAARQAVKAESRFRNAKKAHALAEALLAARTESGAVQVIRDDRRDVVSFRRY